MYIQYIVYGSSQINIVLDKLLNQQSICW